MIGRLLGSLLISLTTICCGKVGAPAPPIHLTERTSSLNAVQRGGAVLLSWPVPALANGETSRSYVQRVDVYRLVERRDQEPVLDSEDYEGLAQVIGSLDRSTIEAQARTLGHLEFSDVINLAGGADIANGRLRYAVRYVNKREQKGTFSNTVSIEPATRAAAPPTELQLLGQVQDSVTLSWAAPDSNVDGTRPASVVGYNVYRWNSKRRPAQQPLNSEPITTPSFTDARFQYDVEYIYLVRALSQGGTGLIESADSRPLSVTPRDTFPPSAPNPVSVASANGVISLFWPSSPERDVTGYLLYRADSADAAEGDWVQLNDEPLTTLTFRDDRVVIGRRYFYRVTAVDRFGNESKPSAVVSETANP